MPKTRMPGRSFRIRRRLHKLWRDHSRTIVGLVLGAEIVAIALVLFPNGGPAWDIVSGVGIVLFSIGIQGVLDALFCETAKAEEPVE